MSPAKGQHHTIEARHKISEARRKQINPMLGKHHSLESRKRMSIAHRGVYPNKETRLKMSLSLRGEGNAMYGKTHSPEARGKIAEVARKRTGWHHSEEAKEKIAQAKRGEKRLPFDDEWKAKLSRSGIGRILSEEHRQNLSKSVTEERRRTMSESMRGTNNPLWQGGKSFEPYTPEFNAQLKDFIRERDSHRCQLCGIVEEDYGKSLDVHHIDYDKKNSQPSNLIALCSNCNNRANFNREYWETYFRQLLERR